MICDPNDEQGCLTDWDDHRTQLARVQPEHLRFFASNKCSMLGCEKSSNPDDGGGAVDLSDIVDREHRPSMGFP